MDTTQALPWSKMVQSLAAAEYVCMYASLPWTRVSLTEHCTYIFICLGWGEREREIMILQLDK